MNNDENQTKASSPSPAVDLSGLTRATDEDEPSHIEQLITCLGDDAATLAAANPDDEMAQTMREAAEALELCYTAGAAKGNTLIGKASICVCGEPETGGVTHRTDGPCYVAECATPARDVGGLTDARITEIIARIGSHSLNVTRIHEIGGKTTTIMESEGVIEFARAIEREVLSTKEAEPVQAEVRNAVRDAVAQALDGVYYCGRVWSAWQVGTMTEDDFTPAAEVDEVLDEITDAAIRALATSPAPSVKQEVGDWQPISTLPYADDLVWLRHGDSIEGPRSMGTDDYDRFSEWAPCEPPSFLAAPSASQGEVKVPEGYKLVPLELSIEMAVAAFGRESIEHAPGIDRVDDEAQSIWNALLSAAPGVTDGEGKHE